MTWAVMQQNMGTDITARRLVSTYSLVMVLSAWFATQIQVPSKATLRLTTVMVKPPLVLHTSAFGSR